MKVSGSKDVRAEARILERLGFKYDRHTGRNHPVYRHPAYGEIELSSASPGHRKNLALLMGMTVMSLEALIAGQTSVGKRHASTGRKRSRPDAARHLHVAPEALAAPPVPGAKPVVAYAPTDPISNARRAQWAALQGEYVREHLRNPYPWPSASRRSAAA